MVGGSAAAVLAGLLLGRPAAAQILDDIELRIDQDIAEASVGFSVPVRYVRHFPVERGEIIEVYFQATTVEGFEQLGRTEYRKSPPSDAVPCFTVTISPDNTDLLREPFRVVVRFRRPVNFKLRPARDLRGFTLFIPLETETAGRADAKKYHDCP